MNAKTKTILSGVITVVVLAAVILGLWAFSSPKKSTPPTIQLNPAQQSAQLLAQGKKALSQNDTSTAVSLFEKAVEVDPANEGAKQALAAAEATSSSTTGTTGKKTPAKSTPASSDVWLKKLDTDKLLPTAFPDYSIGSKETVGTDTQVTGTPAKPNPTVTSIVWAIHDQGSASDATKFVTNVSKKLYTKDVSNPSINGVAAHFGTDGQRFATVSFVRGRYVFEVIITSNRSPVSDKALAVQAAEAFGTTPK